LRRAVLLHHSISEATQCSPQGSCAINVTYTGESRNIKCDTNVRNGDDFISSGSLREWQLGEEGG
jgi:hypothetical protein